MAIDTNIVVLCGRLTRDPEAHTTKNGKTGCKFSIAVNDGEYNGTAQVYFINIQAWGKTAEICLKYLLKGSQVVVNGKLKANTIKTKEGTLKTFYEVMTSNVQFIGGKSDKPKQENVWKDPFDQVDFTKEDSEIPF